MFNISKMVPCKTHGIKRGLSTPPTPPPPPPPPPPTTIPPLSMCQSNRQKKNAN